MKLHGFLDAEHPLSPAVAFRGLEPKIRQLVDYAPESLWEQDTRRLPRPLARYRRKVRDFARAELRPHALQMDQKGEDADDNTAELLSQAARAGLFSDLLPSPFGSNSLRLATHPLHLVQSLKMEELCAACGGLGLMIGAHSLGAMPLLFSGSLRTIRRFVIPASKASKKGTPRLFAFAITEPSGGSDVEDGEGAAQYKPRTVARRVNGGWRLSGRKVFISGGDIAHAVTVFAALENEGLESWTCFLVERGMHGFEAARNELKMGQRASSATELVFDDVFVPDTHVVGKLRQGWAINRAVLNYSRIPVGSIALGIARGAMEAAIDFVCAHELGGKALIHYQEVQLCVAQMLIDTSAMRAMIWQSASTWTARQSRASMTKVFCSDTAVKVCEAAMELLGDHGFHHANRVEKAYRDARLTQIYEGTNQINRLAIIEEHASELLERVATKQRT